MKTRTKTIKGFVGSNVLEALDKIEELESRHRLPTKASHSAAHDSQ